MLAREHLGIIVAGGVYIASLVMMYPEPACVLDITMNMPFHFAAAQLGCGSSRMLGDRKYRVVDVLKVLEDSSYKVRNGPISR